MNTVMLKKIGIAGFWSMLALIVIVLLVVLLIYFYPKKVNHLQVSTAKKIDYKQSIAAIEKSIADDKRNPDIEDRCLPIIKTHDKKTAKAVVMLHGVGACPEQFKALANTYFSAGYNVYVPRVSQHGFKDNMNHSKISTKHLADFMNTTATNASGLGEDVGVVGLSGGAGLATWMVQHTDIFSRTLLLSPFYEPSTKHAQKWKIPFMIQLYGRDVAPDSINGDLSIRALAKYVLVRSNYPPNNAAKSLKHIAVITSKQDSDIDLLLAHSIPRTIHTANKTTFQETQLSDKFGVIHDIVNPNAPGVKKNQAQLYKLYLDMYENKKQPSANPKK